MDRTGLDHTNKEREVRRSDYGTGGEEKKGKGKGVIHMQFGETFFQRSSHVCSIKSCYNNHIS